MTTENVLDACTLPYPDRFHAAVNFVDQVPAGAKPLPDETKLVLYALNQQATEGPCTQPKPWGWNIVENAKWQSWKQLGELSGLEAMRLYVRALEDVEPLWWKVLQESKKKSAAAMTSPADKQPLWPPALAAAAVPAAWVSPTIEGPKQPAPRYDHAMARIATQVYVVGGSCGGRYLSDVWVLDIENLTWRNVAYSSATVSGTGASGEAVAADSAEEFQPVAGHKLVAWGSNVLCLGGHFKMKNSKAPMSVWSLDTTNMTWARITPAGEAPVNRGSHSATLVGKKVYIYGGEDGMRRPLGDLWALDLETMTWSCPETTGTAPRERSAHVATAFRGRYLLLFGGGSLAHCFNDLHLLDTETLVWSKPNVTGALPAPRAGSTGALLTDKWYVIGGGDNRSGCTDVVMLDLKPVSSGGPMSWETVERVSPDSPVACEGMAVVPVTTAALLLAFGGYNGRYHASVQLYQPTGVRPELETTLSQELPALANGLVSAAAEAPTSPGKADGTLSPQASVRSGGGYGEQRLVDAEAAMRAAQESAARAEAERAASAEAQAVAQTALAESERAIASLKGQLEVESSRAFKLEVEVAELRKQLAAMDELQHELNKYRQQEKEAAEARSKTGIWGYISGAS